jgi:general secretion pathway protein C
MRLALDPRARRLIRRLPRNTVYSALELILLSLIAIQCARLFWLFLTPLEPIGDWKTASALRPVRTEPSALLGSFDPFFRLSGPAAPAVVTSLNLKLYGVREDRASGRGSAIVGLPDGQQRSFAVGEEIVPGVTLTAVGFDNVTVSRGGAPEQLFLDQSAPAALVGTGGVQSGGAPAQATAPGAAPSGIMPPPGTPLPIVTAPPPAPPPPPPREVDLTREVQFQPRVQNGRLTGVVVQPSGTGELFRGSGLQPGDVVTSLNGQRINSAEQARAAMGQVRGGAADVVVERGGQVISMRVRTGQ